MGNLSRQEMMKKFVLKSATMMSLNERFTHLRRNNNPEYTVRNIRDANAQQMQASFKNRRLAQQMERRPAVMAALKLKKKSLRQRLGQPGVGTVKDRLNLALPSRARMVGVHGRVGLLRGQGTRRGVGGGGLQGRSPLRRNSQGRGRGGVGRSLSRSGSVTNLKRSTSMSSLGRFSLAGGDNYRINTRGTRGVRGYRNTTGRAFRRGRGAVALQAGTSRGGNIRRNSRGNRYNQRGGGRGGNIRRGVGGRGGRTLRGRGGRTPVPSKEELDLQLDQYMANTKSSLDRELDTYMKGANNLSWN
uniref:Chromatin target of PRMT1 protein C-terminal domain-containing protein n=1 Tax=Timema douglasi TaxID=61478 RepID=A0A7R8VS10_TIMDO|nr:unnamed protein product [Timema douglasi]